MGFKNKKVAEEYYKKKHKEKKDFIDNLKRNPCSDCGKIYHPCVMEFDHVPERGVKKFNISTGANFSLKSGALFDELAKCDLVCANCHAIRTYMRNNNITELN